MWGWKSAENYFTSAKKKKKKTVGITKIKKQDWESLIEEECRAAAHFCVFSCVYSSVFACTCWAVGGKWVQLSLQQHLAEVEMTPESLWEVIQYLDSLVQFGQSYLNLFCIYWTGNWKLLCVLPFPFPKACMFLDGGSFMHLVVAEDGRAIIPHSPSLAHHIFIQCTLCLTLRQDYCMTTHYSDWHLYGEVFSFDRVERFRK